MLGNLTSRCYADKKSPEQIIDAVGVPCARDATLAKAAWHSYVLASGQDAGAVEAFAVGSGGGGAVADADVTAAVDARHDDDDDFVDSVMHESPAASNAGGEAVAATSNDAVPGLGDGAAASAASDVVRQRAQGWPPP